jgi:hypothetical protein
VLLVPQDRLAIPVRQVLQALQGQLALHPQYQVLPDQRVPQGLQGPQEPLATQALQAQQDLLVQQV